MLLERMELPYALNDLEPYIDAETMDVHYNGHYKAYTDTANEILKEVSVDVTAVDLAEWVLSCTDQNSPLRHNIGGYLNHTFYFQGLRKPGQIEDWLDDEIKQKINPEAFKQYVITIAKYDLRGSGYAWLGLTRDTKELHVVLSQNQEVDFMNKFTPILNVDLWEHAYYLKHKNQKVDYINDLFKVINWEMVGQRLYKEEGR